MLWSLLKAIKFVLVRGVSLTFPVSLLKDLQNHLFLQTCGLIPIFRHFQRENHVSQLDKEYLHLFI